MNYRLNIDYSALNISAINQSVSCSAPDNCRVSGSLLVQHYGDAAAPSLRISLITTNGYSEAIVTGITNYVPLPFPGTLTNLGPIFPEPFLPQQTRQITFSDVPIPKPDLDPAAFPRAKGWAIYAVLEQFFQGAWIPVDSTLIGYGPWPQINGTIGPNGGVIRSDPSRPAPNLLFDIALYGPKAVCEQQSDSLSGRALFLVGSSNAQPEWVVLNGPVTISTNGLVTNAVVSVNSLTQDGSATVSAQLAFAGSIIHSTSNLTIQLLNDCSQFRAVSRQGSNFRIQFVDRPNKKLIIEYADALPAPFWTVWTTNTVGLDGRLFMTNAMPLNVRQRFYRAREVP
jgi:hypothetical protein